MYINRPRKQVYKYKLNNHQNEWPSHFLFSHLGVVLEVEMDLVIISILRKK
jgi:hypothetical protein